MSVAGLQTEAPGRLRQPPIRLDASTECRMVRGREVVMSRWRISTAILLGFALGTHAFAGQALGAVVPFKGRDVGGFELPGTCSDGSAQVVISGSGTATHLGRYTFASNECFDPTSGEFSGTPAFRAANGDTIVGTYSGQVFGTDDPDVIRYEEELRITGGTGRFSGASGTITVLGLADLASLSYSQTFTGTLSTG